MNRPLHTTAPVPLLRRLATHPKGSHYYRLMLLVGLCNLALGITGGLSWPLTPPDLHTLLGWTLANLTLAVLIRQQYVINLLFWLATRAPCHWPLGVRRHLAKVFHHGGLHSAGALAATGWFALYLYGLASQWQRGIAVDPALLWVSAVLLGLVSLMCVMAYPALRARWHNAFEQVHRFGGWASLLLLWGHSVLNLRAVHAEAWLQAVPLAPQVWLMLLLSVSIALPWLRLRKVSVALHAPSRHAVVVSFAHGVTPFAGSSTAISLSPWREWHAFANIPTPGEPGFRLIISRAGDWTARFIDQLPSQVWVKGVPTAGVARIETLFRSVLYIATGSGIGPVLPHLLAGQVPIRLLWSTRSPAATYGQALVDEIRQAQPDALIWDTDVSGKPDLIALALQLQRESGAEAVICIANQRLTESLVQAMERRGIPAYGAIWDS